MQAAPRLAIEAPVAARARHIVEVYGDIAADAAALDRALTRLPRHLGKATIATWRAMAAAGEIEPLAAALIAGHYDPAYRRGAEAPSLGVVALETLAAAHLESGADEVARRLKGVSVAR